MRIVLIRRHVYKACPYYILRAYIFINIATAARRDSLFANKILQFPLIFVLVDITNSAYCYKREIIAEHRLHGNVQGSQALFSFRVVITLKYY
jgi:hypothetical protein